MGMSRGFYVFKILLRVKFRFPVHPSVHAAIAHSSACMELGSCPGTRCRAEVILHQPWYFLFSNWTVIPSGSRK